MRHAGIGGRCACSNPRMPHAKTQNLDDNLVNIQIYSPGGNKSPIIANFETAISQNDERP
jgi:hypothetical protein